MQAAAGIASSVALVYIDCLDNGVWYSGVRPAGEGLVVVVAAERVSGPESGWSSEGRGRIEVYTFRGGRRLAALLQLEASSGLLLLNADLMAPAGRRVATGWALAISELGADGYYALYRDPPMTA